MIIEQDLKGVFRWIIVDKGVVIVDPRYKMEYETSVLNNVDRLNHF